ncbi:MAG: hypothetical protein M0Z71_06830 [Nitrospiraceae bacterium]|nr:hypothetical protein [Nitrospiraceae bacterium]
MKGVISNFLIGLLMVLAFTACSKQPVQEINAAKAAVDSAMAEGAEKYSPAEARNVNDELAAALAEVHAQDARFLKDYKKAKEMLAKTKADADTLKASLAAKKEEAKKQALAAQESAIAAVEEAKASLAKAMRSNTAKGLDALNADATGLDDSLLEVKNLIDTEDYTTALDKADAVKKGAAALMEQVKQITPEKTPKGKAVPKKKRH